MKKLDRRSVFRGTAAMLGAGLLSQVESEAQAPKRATPAAAKADDCNCALGTDGSPLDTGTSELRPVIERYDVELRNVNRVYPLPGSPVRQSKLEAFYADQLRLLEKMNFDALSQAGKVDYLLLRSRLDREKRQLADEARHDAEIAAILPFQPTITGLEEARRRMETIDGHASAVALAKLTSYLADTKASMPKAPPAVLGRAAVRLSR